MTNGKKIKRTQQEELPPLKSKDHLPALLNHLPVGVYRTTPDGRILEANDTLIKMLGYKNETELKKYNVKDLYVEGKQRERLVKKIASVLKHSEELELACKDGRTLWGKDVSLAVTNKKGDILFYDGIIIDITKQKKAEEGQKKANTELKKANKEKKRIIKELQAQSLTDDLTSLYNRRGFLLVAADHMKLADRNKKPMFLLFIDIDNLKTINDTYGHHMGDEALQILADMMRHTFRRSDVKGRMGGDEFAVFPIGSTRRGVDIVLRRLDKNIKAFNKDMTNPFELTVSMGISCYNPKHPCSMDDLLVRADKMMYEEKRLKTRC